MSSWRHSQSDEFRHAVALGKVPGWESFRKFGTDDTVAGGGGTEDIWPIGTVRVLPAAAGVVSVSSDSTADDGDPTSNTGAHQVVVVGLDASWLEISETVTLNGLSAVTTTASFYRINRAYVNKVGSGGVNAGNITLSIGGATQAYIQAGEGQTAQSQYTVPANKYLLIDYYNVGVGRMAGSSDANIEGQINLYNATRLELEGWRSISNLYLFNGQEHSNPASATLIPPKTEVRAQITSSVNTQAHAVFGGYLIRTDHLGGL